MVSRALTFTQTAHCFGGGGVVGMVGIAGGVVGMVGIVGGGPLGAAPAAPPAGVAPLPATGVAGPTPATAVAPLTPPLAPPLPPRSAAMLPPRGGCASRSVPVAIDASSPSSARVLPLPAAPAAPTTAASPRVETG